MELLNEKKDDDEAEESRPEKVREAKRRQSLEDPDEDEVVI